MECDEHAREPDDYRKHDHASLCDLSHFTVFDTGQAISENISRVILKNDTIVKSPDHISPNTGPATCPMLIWDGSCSFCRIWIEYCEHLTEGRVKYVPFQEASDQYPQITHEDFERSVQLVQEDGKIVGGARAVFGSLAYVPGLAWLLWLYRWFPGFGPLSEVAYRFVAGHRAFFYRVTVFFLGQVVS